MNSTLNVYKEAVKALKAAEQSMQVREQAARDGSRRRSETFLRMRSKEFEELEWWRPRE